MSDEIREAMYTAVSLIVSSIFLGIMITFWILGYQFSYKSEEKQARIARIPQEAEIQRFINSAERLNGVNGQVATTVSGSDIIQFIVDNGTRYTYEIKGIEIKDPVIRAKYTDNNPNSSTITIANVDDYKDNATKLYSVVRDFYAPKALDSNVTKADDIKNADVYTAVDSALWTQACLSEYIFGDAVFETYIPYVEYLEGYHFDTTNAANNIVDDADEIIDNYKTIKFVFVKK